MQFLACQTNPGVVFLSVAFSFFFNYKSMEDTPGLMLQNGDCVLEIDLILFSYAESY